VSSRTARAIQRNPVSKNNNNNNNNNKKPKNNTPPPQKRRGAEEMAQRFRALAALPEVLSSIPSNQMVAHNHL
jgi:hypothetical protein